MPSPPPAAGASGRLGTLRHQLLAFALVGGIGVVLDLVVFNALRLTVLAPEVNTAGPILAKLISTSVAILANWLGNRYWTFGPHRRDDSWVEGFEFFLVSLLGMAVGLACLWVSHYVLGFTSVLADNISSNVIGLALGSIVRFALYRHWVFHPERRRAKSADADTGDSGARSGARRTSRFAGRTSEAVDAR